MSRNDSSSLILSTSITHVTLRYTVSYFLITSATTVENCHLELSLQTWNRCNVSHQILNEPCALCAAQTFSRTNYTVPPTMADKHKEKAVLVFVKLRQCDLIFEANHLLK